VMRTQNFHNRLALADALAKSLRSSEP